MKNIGITIDEVLRDFVGQLAYTYTKYVDGDFDLKEDSIVSDDFNSFFKFDNINEFNEFIYDEAALEIFGHADQLHENIMTNFNNFLIEIEDEEEFEITLITEGVSKSIPSTLFFLSKLSCRAKNIKFVNEYNEDVLSEFDVLVSATPKALNSLSSDKKSIKINTTYNKSVDSDYSFNTLMEFMDNEELINKLNK